MKKTLSLLVVLAFVSAMLPWHSTEAQTRRRSATDPGQYRTTATPGTAAYYNDDMVRYSGTAYVRVARVEYMVIIGGSPQVPGGATSAPQDDEEDVDNDRVRQVETKAANGKVYLGELDTVMRDGATKVRIRRKKATHKLLMILNCGNWARELGVGIITEIQYQETDCKPKLPETKTISEEGYDRVEVTTDGCTTTITKVRVDVRTNNVPTCIPGTWKILVETGNAIGKLKGQKFKVKSVIGADVSVRFDAQYGNVGNLDAQYVMLLEDACPASGTAQLKLVALVSGGGGWHWKEFLIGVAVGTILGFFIGRASVDCPRITDTAIQKIQNSNQVPNRNGVAPGGILNQAGKKVPNRL